MADTHLTEANAILRTLNTVIIFSAAESVPHNLYICRKSQLLPSLSNRDSSLLIQDAGTDHFHTRQNPSASSQNPDT